jgi:ABC-2 type transport system permease protein
MIHDVWTVARKEWLEIIDQLLRFKRGGWSILLVIAFLGVVSPLQMGQEWLSSPLMFFYWPLLTSSMTSTLIADAIAGERERHTLETLLATRLSDTAIILGKILAAVLYGFTIPLSRVAALYSLIGAGSFFISGVGVFVSLRATTVRQAQQTFGVIILLLMMTPVLLTQFTTPDFQLRVLAGVGRMGLESLAFRAAGVLGALAALLNAAAIGRFKRGKLALD